MVQYSNFDIVTGARNHLCRASTKHFKNVKIKTSIGKKVCFALLSTVIIFLCTNSCTGVNAQSSAVNVQSSDVGERWEYKILELNIIYGNNDVNSDTLNDLGKQGWELIFVTVGDQTVNRTPTHLFTLKRKLP